MIGSNPPPPIHGGFNIRTATISLPNAEPSMNVPVSDSEWTRPAVELPPTVIFRHLTIHGWMVGGTREAPWGVGNTGSMRELATQVERP
jgi:hypothetical protein